MKAHKKDLIIFLVLEIIAVVWAGLVFSIFESRLLAGAMAGIYFVASGLYIFRVIWRWQNKWQFLMIYPLWIHVFLVSIPMVVSRFSQMQSDFEQVKIWGLEGPVFHQLSSTIFMVLIASTVVDLIRALKSK